MPAQAIPAGNPFAALLAALSVTSKVAGANANGSADGSKPSAPSPNSKTQPADSSQTADPSTMSVLLAMSAAVTQTPPSQSPPSTTAGATSGSAAAISGAGQGGAGQAAMLAHLAAAGANSRDQQAPPILNTSADASAPPPQSQPPQGPVQDPTDSKLATPAQASLTAQQPAPTQQPAPSQTPSQLAANPGATGPANAQFQQQGGNAQDKGSGDPHQGSKPAAAPAAAVQAKPAANFSPSFADSSNTAAAPVTPAPLPQVQATLQVSQPQQVQGSAQAVPLADLGLLAFSIAQQTRDGVKRFDISLHPADLGSIQVHMSVDAAGQAQLHMQAENPQTLQMLRQDAPQLQSALKDAGLNLAGGGLNFSLKGEQQQQGGSGQSGARNTSRPLALSAVASATAAAAPLSTYAVGASSARLDIQV